LSRCSFVSPMAASSGPGVGLRNVRRRLEICYGAAARLELEFRGEETVVELLLPVSKPVAAR